MKRQTFLRLAVFNRDFDSHANSSSMDKPVRAEMRRRFFGEGKHLSFSHSQTVGCLTPSSSANAVCDNSEASSHFFKGSMLRSIGDSYANAIGQTYAPFGHADGMEEQTFWDRVLEALRDRGVNSGQQTYVAKLIKIKQPSVAEWVTGSIPSMQNARKLALKIGVNVEWLLTGRGEKRPGRPSDAFAEELWQIWPKLNDAAKQQIIGFAAVAEKNPAPKQPETRQKKTG
jgi:hypothetical protein